MTFRKSLYVEFVVYIQKVIKLKNRTPNVMSKYSKAVAAP